MIKYHQKQSTKIDGLPSRIFSTIRCSVQMQIDMTQWFMFHINDKSILRYSNSCQSYSITCHIYSVICNARNSSRPVRNIKNYNLRPKDRCEFVYTWKWYKPVWSTIKLVSCNSPMQFFTNKTLHSECAKMVLVFVTKIW